MIGLLYRLRNEPKHGFSRVKVESMNVKMKEVWTKMVKKRGLRRTGKSRSK